MIERHELDLIAESLANIVKPLIKRIEELEKREPSVITNVLEAPPVEVDYIALRDQVFLEVTRLMAESATGTEERLRQLLAKEIADTFAALPPAQPGDPGKPGKDAESIHPDTVNLMVLKAVQEAVAVMKPSKDGEDGQDGRDALQIDVLPAIDETRSFPRGTYAHYKGSLVRAVRNTEPGEPLKSGWEIVVEGFTPLEIKQGDDLRTFTFIQRTTGGQVTEKSVTLPVFLYRGIWKSGTYEAGDVVTYDNQLWHCNEDTTDTPGLSKGWQLTLRKPRDGKDGKQGEKGDPGPKGDRGLDFRYQ